jgi:hypothetical protein
MSVVRATTGTRINEDGLVELVPYNYIQYSELFSDASWTKTDSNIVGGFISPTGDANASKLSVTAANGIIQKPVSLTDLRTVSIYAKRGTHQYLRFGAYGGTNSYGNFDLENGVITSGANTQIEDVGNGWYRCTCHSANGTTGGVQIFSSNSPTGAATTAGDIYIWGAQANEGSSALDYLPTTDRLDVARIDYSSGSGALLVEPQRTNLVLQSSSFDNAAWTKEDGNGGSLPIVTANYGISPDGTQNADRIQLTRTTTSGSFSYVWQLFSVSAGQTYTWSVWLKSLSGTPSIVLSYDGASYTNNVTLTNEWKRYEFTTTISGTTLIANFLLWQQLPSTSLTADFLAYGFQLEQGNYATSYIPTTSASVTRNADVISKTGISSLIGQTEGTFFVDIIFGQQLSPNWFFSLIGTDWITNSFYIERASNGLISVIAVKNGSGIGEATSSVTAINGQRAKIAVQYASSQFNIFVNGTKYIGTISAIPTCNDIYINQIGTLGSSNNHLQKNEFNAVALWKTALTDAQCQTLTTI